MAGVNDTENGLEALT